MLVYEGPRQSPTADAAGRYTFVAEFRSENGAALIANVLWSALHTRAVSLTIEEQPVALDHPAIKDALLRSARGTDVAA